MKRRDELLVGLLLIISVVLLLGGTIWIARGGLKRGYPMYTRFDWGAGLKPGQPVLLAGVQVGFVEHVDLIPDGTIAVRMSVQDEYRIPVGTTASVEPSGIFGDQVIALTPKLASTDYLAKSDTIPSGPGAIGLPELLQKGDSIAINLRALSDKVRTQYVEGGGLEESRRTITQLTKLVSQLSSIATEQSRQLTLTQQQMRRTLASVDSAVVDSTLRSMRTATANLEVLSRDLKQTNEQAQELIDKLSNGKGTAGKFVNDPSLYNRMDVLLARVDSLTMEFKSNPRKFINLRIF